MHDLMACEYLSNSSTSNSNSTWGIERGSGGRKGGPRPQDLEAHVLRALRAWGVQGTRGILHRYGVQLVHLALLDAAEAVRDGLALRNPGGYVVWRLRVLAGEEADVDLERRRQARRARRIEEARQEARERARRAHRFF